MNLLMFSWNTAKRPILALAPMAGYTDSPFRQIVKELCPRVICFTELTSVDGLLHSNAATLRQISFCSAKERPIIAQIFGNKPELFVHAAKLLAELGVDAIDINMGCPARKIISSDHGSALLKNPTLACEIVAAAVSGAGALPVSVKTRIGISKYDEDFFLSFVSRLAQAGTSLIAIHGRTAKQMYTGTADWGPAYAAKKILKIPVIGNGDIKSGADAVKRLNNLNGIMVGRGALGNPWIFQEIEAAFTDKKFNPLTIAQKMPLIKKHLKLACELKNKKWGIFEMRKHLAFYIRGFPNASYLRQKLMTADSLTEINKMLEECLSI